MPISDIVKGLFIYKEPKDPEGFELLENEYEDETAPKPDKQSSEKRAVREEAREEQALPDTVSEDLRANMERMKQEFNIPKNKDIIIREFKVARKINAFILYIDGMVNKNTVNNLILKQLMSPVHFLDFKEGSNLDYIIDNVLSLNRVIKEQAYDEIVSCVLNGTTALFIDGCEECIIIEALGYEKRNVDKPVTENVIRGSQEGFSESMITNIALIRRIIKNKNLITEIMPVDRTNKTNCAILYVKDIANPAVIREVKRRLANLNIDFISSSGMLEELISDQTMMPFAQVLTTERPDRAAAGIMDGKVILLLDGVPFVSLIPTSFFESLQSSEDFSLKWQYATFLRYLRILALFITLLLPGLYGAVILFHQEMIPTELLNSIVKSRENVPFPIIVEIIFMEMSFELIREGGIRVPGVIGNTLGIVGALILGQAAVQAQLVSPVLIIIIAVVGISSFAIPSYSMAFELRLFRFVFIFSGAIAGFYGISVVLIVTLGLACSVKSFGVPYFAPIAPKTKSNLDVIATLPAYKQKMRSDFSNSLNKYKAGEVTQEWIKKKDGDKK
ncbi:MAG: spore germination protein [Clostridiaceae bacterium]|jgi:spore germination protein KA|nr:spore germination protein [Clostridiaceae bacterium]